MNSASLAPSAKGKNVLSCVGAKYISRRLSPSLVRAACIGSLGIVALAALRPVMARCAQTIALRPTQSEQTVSNVKTPIVAVNNKATLPDGATITFVGITDFKTLTSAKEYH